MEKIKKKPLVAPRLIILIFFSVPSYINDEKNGKIMCWREVKKYSVLWIQPLNENITANNKFFLCY